MKVPNPLELSILAVLEHQPRHGYSLREQLRQRSSGSLDPPPGTLYPLLRRLESRGLVASAWRAGPRRRRRVYRLTDTGRRELDRRLLEWVDFVGTVTTVIG